MKTVYVIKNLCCANCAAKIERAAAKLAGVESVSVNFITQKMTVEVEGEESDALYEKLFARGKKHAPTAGLAKA
jgi:copper chaperone CopZ